MIFFFKRNLDNKFIFDLLDPDDLFLTQHRKRFHWIENTVQAVQVHCFYVETHCLLHQLNLSWIIFFFFFILFTFAIKTRFISYACYSFPYSDVSDFCHVWQCRIVRARYTSLANSLIEFMMRQMTGILC